MEYHRQEREIENDIFQATHNSLQSIREPT